MKLEVRYQGKSTLDAVLHEVVGRWSSGGGYDLRTGVSGIEWSFTDLESLQTAKLRIESDPRLASVETRVQN